MKLINQVNVRRLKVIERRAPLDLPGERDTGTIYKTNSNGWVRFFKWSGENWFRRCKVGGGSDGKGRLAVRAA